MSFFVSLSDLGLGQSDDSSSTPVLNFGPPADQSSSPTPVLNFGPPADQSSSPTPALNFGPPADQSSSPTPALNFGPPADQGFAPVASPAPQRPAQAPKTSNPAASQSSDDQKALFGFFGALANAGASVSSAFIKADAQKYATGIQAKTSQQTLQAQLRSQLQATKNALAGQVAASGSGSSTAVYLMAGLGLVGILVIGGGAALLLRRQDDDDDD